MCTTLPVVGSFSESALVLVTAKRQVVGVPDTPAAVGATAAIAAALPPPTTTHYDEMFASFLPCRFQNTSVTNAVGTRTISEILSTAKTAARDASSLAADWASTMRRATSYMPAGVTALNDRGVAPAPAPQPQTTAFNTARPPAIPQKVKFEDVMAGR